MLTEGMHLTPLHTLVSSVLGQGWGGAFPFPGQSVLLVGCVAGAVCAQSVGGGTSGFPGQVWGAELVLDR